MSKSKERIFGFLLSKTMEEFDVSIAEIEQSLSVTRRTVQRWKREIKKPKLSTDVNDKGSESLNRLVKIITKRYGVKGTLDESTYAKIAKHAYAIKEFVLELSKTQKDMLSFNVNQILEIEDYDKIIFEALKESIENNFELTARNMNMFGRKKNSKKKDKLKAVVIDFDGTLVSVNDKQNTWSKLFKTLNSTDRSYEEHENKFLVDQLEYDKWIDVLNKDLKAKGFMDKHIERCSESLKHVGGLPDFFDTFWQNNIKIFIVSNSVHEMIRASLKDYCWMISEISANCMVFNSDGFLESIVPTKYHYKTKDRYISRVMRNYGFSIDEIAFIGDSNDYENVIDIGCRTICTNKSKSDSDEMEIVYPNYKEIDIKDDITAVFGWLSSKFSNITPGT